jgi:hypothetical protein
MNMTNNSNYYAKHVRRRTCLSGKIVYNHKLVKLTSLQIIYITKEK